jgi:hypothetical protein
MTANTALMGFAVIFAAAMLFNAVLDRLYEVEDEKLAEIEKSQKRKSKGDHDEIVDNGNKRGSTSTFRTAAPSGPPTEFREPAFLNEMRATSVTAAAFPEVARQASVASEVSEPVESLISINRQMRELEPIEPIAQASPQIGATEEETFDYTEFSVQSQVA